MQNLLLKLLINFLLEKIKKRVIKQYLDLQVHKIMKELKFYISFIVLK